MSCVLIVISFITTFVIFEAHVQVIGADVFESIKKSVCVNYVQLEITGPNFVQI